MKVRLTETEIKKIQVMRVLDSKYTIWGCHNDTDIFIYSDSIRRTNFKPIRYKELNEIMRAEGVIVTDSELRDIVVNKYKVADTKVEVESDTKTEDTRVFFDQFETGIKLKNGKDEDIETKLFEWLESSDWQLIRVVKKEARDLVLGYIKGILTPDTYKNVGYYDTGGVLLLISMCRLEDADTKELDCIKGLTIREMLVDGTEIEHTFPK